MDIREEVSMLRLVTRLLLPFLILLAASAPPACAGQTPQPWVARQGLSSADYQKAFDQFGKEGFELVSVSGYLASGELRYAALWRKPVTRRLGRRVTACRPRTSKRRSAISRRMG